MQIATQSLTTLRENNVDYLELIRTVFQAVNAEGKLRNRIVAFTSALPNEGVTHVVNSFAKELAEQTQKRVLAVDARRLQSLSQADPGKISMHCLETQIDNLLTLPATGFAGKAIGVSAAADLGKWQADPKYRSACLKALRWNFDYVVIDCPSLALSADATTLAPMIDGVAIVVEAGRTRSRQIQRGQKIVESTGGNFLGFVLNQRRYPVPNWLYRRL